MFPNGVSKDFVRIVIDVQRNSKGLGKELNSFRKDLIRALIDF